jgi:hypothetical protein
MESFKRLHRGGDAENLLARNNVALETSAPHDFIQMIMIRN